MGRKKDKTGRFVASHGDSRSREYGIWGNMLYRCRTASANTYGGYGGRGIRVCERWESFENFFSDMGPAPVGASIERRDVDGNYEPGNCCWATAKQQARNRRNTIRLTIGGVERPLIEWAEHYGVSWQVVKHRWQRNWPPWRLFQPIRKYEHAHN